MVVTIFSDLLKEINSRAVIATSSAALSGFTQGLGLSPLQIPTPPQFTSSAKSMEWLLANAKTVRTLSQQTEAAKIVKNLQPSQIIDSMATLNPQAIPETETPPNTVQIDSPLRIGDMIMFMYDPKTKQRLPYWDTFPLVFPIKLRNNGFDGLNMHYLPPYSRAILMDALYGLITNTEMNESTRLQINYAILKNSAKYKEYKPCYKRYLFGHLRSVRAKVEPREWDMVLMLPLARFVKADQLKVWNDSLDKIRGIK